MNWIYPWLFLILPISGPAQSVDPLVLLDVKTRPAKINAEALTEFAMLSAERRKLIEIALAVADESPWLPYLAGGDSPSAGGFDCSGAMYFILRKASQSPPRVSGAQMEWLRQCGRLHQVSSKAMDLAHVSLAELKPGDLLFWAVTDRENTVRFHHVAMYLGTERMDGRPVMIGSTNGRSYRGQKTNGYGVYDWKVPKMDSPSKFIGYGTPPEIGVE